MDPISITATVLGLVGHSITAIQTCQGYAAKYKTADLSMNTMRTECSAIKLALVQIQRLLSRDQYRPVKDQFDVTVMEEYQSVLSSCQLTFETLNNSLLSLGFGGGSNLSESTFRTKMKYLWNEPQTQILHTSISGQQNAITLLLSIFQAERSDMVYSLLRNEKAVRFFARVSSDSASLRRSLTSDNASSISTSSTASALGDEDFSFDNLVINSTAYRNAFVRQQSKLHPQNSSRKSTPSLESGSTAASIRSETTVKPVKGSKKWEAITLPGGLEVVPRNALGRLLGGLLYKELVKEPGTTASAYRTHVEPKGYEKLTGGRIARMSALEGHTDTPIDPLRDQPLTVLVPRPNPKDTRDAPSPAQPQMGDLSFFKDYYSSDKIFVGNLVSVLWAFKSRADDEFTLERGDVLEVEGIWEDGWAAGMMCSVRAESLTDGKHEGELSGTIKAFSLACVCLPQHWRRTIEGDEGNNPRAEINSASQTTLP